MPLIKIPAASIVLLVTFLPAASAWRQANETPKVKFTLASKSAKAGSVVAGTVEVSFAEGLHGYQNPPLGEFQIPVKIECDTKGVAAKVKYPKGAVQKVAGEDAAVYGGTISFPITFTLPKKPGKLQIKVTVSYQQCTETMCYPPGKVSAMATLTVKASGKGKA